IERSEPRHRSASNPRGSLVALNELDFMDSGLQAVERGIAAASLDKIVMTAILDEAARVDGDDPVGAPHGREPVGDDEDSAALCDLLHVLLDHPLALIIERARRLVEDQDPRVGDESAGDRDPLLLAPR